MQTYIAFQGYYKNKKTGDEQKIDTNQIQTFLDDFVSWVSGHRFAEWE